MTHDNIFLTQASRQWYLQGIQGISQGMRPANERRIYIVTTSLIGWAHT